VKLALEYRLFDSGQSEFLEQHDAQNLPQRILPGNAALVASPQRALIGAFRMDQDAFFVVPLLDWHMIAGLGLFLFVGGLRQLRRHSGR
jgi:hypothetical protein